MSKNGNGHGKGKRVSKACDSVKSVKRVGLPLKVEMEGDSVKLKANGDKLVQKLRSVLPMTFRLGRGHKETITISVR